MKQGGITSAPYFFKAITTYFSLFEHCQHAFEHKLKLYFQYYIYVDQSHTQLTDARCCKTIVVFCPYELWRTITNNFSAVLFSIGGGHVKTFW